jgi:non-homologous end joining protein Ku
LSLDVTDCLRPSERVRPVPRFHKRFTPEKYEDEWRETLLEIVRAKAGAERRELAAAEKTPPGR